MRRRKEATRVRLPREQHTHQQGEIKRTERAQPTAGKTIAKPTASRQEQSQKQADKSKPTAGKTRAKPTAGKTRASKIWRKMEKTICRQEHGRDDAEKRTEVFDKAEGRTDSRDDG